jgi:hypothetical protein
MPKFSTSVQQSFEGFRDDFRLVEAALPAWADRAIDVRRAIKRGERRAAQVRQNNVEFLVAITLGGLVTRVRDLSSGVIGLVNKDNAHAAPPVARALFETCCVPIYLRRELLPRVRKGKTNQVHKLVFRLTLGGIEVGETALIKPIRVDSLLKSARAELRSMVEAVPDDEQIGAEQLIKMYYGPLTELTHPNWGALQLDTKLGFPPRIASSATFDEFKLHAVVSSCAYILDAGGRALDSVVTTLEQTRMDLPNGGPDWSQ